MTSEVGLSAFWCNQATPNVSKSFLTFAKVLVLQRERNKPTWSSAYQRRSKFYCFFLRFVFGSVRPVSFFTRWCRNLIIAHSNDVVVCTARVGHPYPSAFHAALMLLHDTCIRAGGPESPADAAFCQRTKN